MLDDKVGKTSTQTAAADIEEWHEKYVEFIHELKALQILPADVGESSASTLRNFAFHKTAAPTKNLLLAVLALFVAKFEQDKNFDATKYPHIPECEINLERDIRMFLGRQLDNEADKASTERPFDLKPLWAGDDYRSVPFGFTLDEGRIGDWNDIFSRYQLQEKDGGNGNAHFTLFRERKSSNGHLIKSFLAIGPAKERSVGSLYFHPTFHLYQAPGGKTRRATTGKVIPLKAGVFILGGQYPVPLERRQNKRGKERVPFRSLEMLYFPWTTFENEPLINGLMLTINNKEEMMVTRVTARPTLIQHSDDATIGNIKIDKLHEHLSRAFENEAQAAGQLDEETCQRILDTFEHYEDRLSDAGHGVAGLAQRIELATHNHNDELKLNDQRRGPLSADRPID